MKLKVMWEDRFELYNWNCIQGAISSIQTLQCCSISVWATLPLGDEPLRLRPVLRVVVEEACWDLQRSSFRQELAVHHTIVVDVSRKPSWKCHEKEKISFMFHTQPFFSPGDVGFHVVHLAWDATQSSQRWYLLTCHWPYLNPGG